MFIESANDLRYSPFPHAMSCSRFLNATVANRRAFWLSYTTPSASIHSPELVLDVDLANVSSVALEVVQADITRPTLASTIAPMRPLNAMICIRQHYPA